MDAPIAMRHRLTDNAYSCIFSAILNGCYSKEVQEVQEVKAVSCK